MGLFKKIDLDNINGVINIKDSVSNIDYYVRNSIVIKHNGLDVPLLRFIESEFFYDDESNQAEKFLRKLLKGSLITEDGKIVTFTKAKSLKYLNKNKNQSTDENK